MGRKKSTGGRKKYKSTKIPEIFYKELQEICKALGLTIPQCLSHLIHEAYLNFKAGLSEIEEKSTETLKQQLAQTVQLPQVPESVLRHVQLKRPPPPP
jgi:hypothetical protein